MADLNITTTQACAVHENAGQNLILNGGFESAPSFTAATTTSGRWIDGTATGSTTNDTWGWAMTNHTGTSQVQFDSSQSNSGSNSIKTSTLATGSRADVAISTSINAANVAKYLIPALPSTAYKVTYSQMTTVTSGSSSSGSRLRAQEYNDAGTQQGADRNGTSVLTTTGWTARSITFTTTSTTTAFNITCNVVGTDGSATLIADAWFDDIVVYPIARIAGVDIQIGPIITPGVQNLSGPKIWS